GGRQVSFFTESELGYLSLEDRPMSSERPDRRAFLKRGAALAGGLSLGAAEPIIGQTVPSGQSQEVPAQQVPDHESPELVAYGVRSHRVTSVRIAHPPG